MPPDAEAALCSIDMTTNRARPRAAPPAGGAVVPRRARVRRNGPESGLDGHTATATAQLLKGAVEEAATLLEADGAMIYLLDEDGQTLRFAHDAGIADLSRRRWVRRLRLTVGEGMFGVAVADRRVVATRDYPADRTFTHAADPDRFVREVGLRSMVVAPLVHGERVFGGLGTFSTRPDAFSDAQIGLVRALADHAAAAMANALLIAELDRSRNEAARQAEVEHELREIATRISSIRSPDDVIQQTVDAAARLLDADGARIDLIDPVINLLRWAYQSGGTRPTEDVWPSDPNETLDQGVSGKAVTEGTVQWTGDYLRDRRFVHGETADQYIDAVGVHSVMSAPLIGEDGAFGALTVYTTRVDAWGPADAELIDALATEAAIAITNARLIAELGQSREALARRAEAERALREIAARLTAIREPSELLQHVVDEANRLVRADGTILDLLDPATGRLQWAYDSGLSAKFTPEQLADLWLPVGIGATGIAVAEDRVVTAGDDLRSQFPPSSESELFFSATGFRSLIAAPVATDAGPLGALEVYSTRPFAFDDADAALIRSLADQAAIAIANARLIEELARSREEVARRADSERTLREIAARLSAMRDPNEVLEQVVGAATRLLRATGGMIDLVGTTGVEQTWTGSAETATDMPIKLLQDIELDPDAGVSGLAVATGAVQWTADYLADARFRHTPERDQFVAEAGIRSVIAAPLVVGTEAVGAITVFSPDAGAFGPEDEAIARALADQAAVTIANTRLIEELQRSRTDLAKRVETERSLREVAARIAVLRDPDDVLRRIVDEARRLSGSDGAHLTRLSDDGRFVVPEVVAGGLDEDAEAWLRGQRFPLDGGINGLAAGRGEPIWTEDYRTDPRIPLEPDDLDTAERLGLRGMAAVPLRSAESGIIGTLAVSFRRPHVFDDEEIGLLQVLADHAAIAITNASLYERLRRSESSYRHLVQNSPDLVWAIDADARLSFVSDTAERLTGWKPEELIGRHFGALVHESSREVAEIDWTAGMAMGSQEIRGRLSLLHRDGRAIPAEFIAIGALDADGRFVGANGSVRDMTDLDRLERELRASEARYRNLLQSSPDLIWAADPEGRYTFMSDRTREILGWDPADWVGHHFGDFLVPGSMDDAIAADAAVRASPGEVIRVRLVLRHADGHGIPFEVHAVGLAEDGELVGVNGVARDVSEREALERELRDSEARFRQLVQTTPDVIWRADTDGVFTFMADNGEALFGYPVEEIVGRHFGFLTTDETMPIARQNYAAIATEPDVVRHVPLTLVRSDGSTFEAEVTVVGVFEDGVFVGGQGTVRDVSDRETLERDLRRQAGELAAGEERAHLARELHDSVTQALFSMTLLSRSIEMLVDRDAETAKQKLAELRDLQREALAEMRALIFELRPGNLEQEGLITALRTHSAALQGRIGLPIVVTSDLAERLPIEIEELLYRIAQEALHNVVKHAAARQVRIEVGRSAGDARLRVVDDGKGFDPGAVPPGHLGLAGMRARAERVGGRIDVRSTMGSGTTIKVSVPLGAGVPAVGSAE